MEKKGNLFAIRKKLAGIVGKRPNRHGIVEKYNETASLQESERRSLINKSIL